MQDMVVINHKEIPVFLLGNGLTVIFCLSRTPRIYQQIWLQYEFSPILSSYHCNSKVFSKGKNTEPPENELYTGNNFLFQLHAPTQMQLRKAKTNDFYCLSNQKINTVSQSGPMKWNSIISLDENAWEKFPPS